MNPDAQRGPILLAPLALVLLAAAATGQTAEQPTRFEVLDLDSGLAANHGAQAGPIAAFHVFVEGAPWMRLSFGEVLLSGEVGAGTGSRIRITSLLDGHHQLLDAVTIEQWEHTSAYFNGDVVLVEILAEPGTGPSRVTVDGVTYGLRSGLQASICGVDDRTASSDPRVARIMPIGCTGFLIDDDCGCFLTAGHCTSSSAQVVQFDVPLSNSNGSTNNPSPEDQYVIDRSSLQSNGGQGVGNDWAYFGVFPNSTTGKTPLLVQGAAFPFQAPPPTWQSGLEVRITGYGVDGGTANQTQQTHVGPWVSYSGGTALMYMTDTQGGNSGSPIIQEQAGVAMGIHTHGGCTSSGGQNNGTASSHPSLLAALADPQGVCLKTTPPSCGTAPAAVVRNGSGVNPLCLVSASPPAIGTTWEYTVDLGSVPGANWSMVRAQLAGATTTTAIGELLIDISSRSLFTTVRSGPGPHEHGLALPSNVELAGLMGSIQGVVGVDGDPVQLCNAIDFTLGCTQ